MNIDYEINKDEKNTDALGYVWTGTKEDGTPADEFERCLDWTTKNNDYKGYVGKKDKTTRDWTFKDDKACNYERRLCCFKHVPVTTPPTPPATSTKTSKTELTTTNNDATTTSEVVTTTLESSTAGEATTTSDVATTTRDPVTTTEEIIPTSTHPPSRP